MTTFLRKPWIKNYVTQVAETSGVDLSSLKWHQGTKKVQIIEFLTYGTQNPDSPDTVIWARISDKFHHIPVRFSADSVAKYRQEKQKHLTSEKTALITISQFRLIHCRIPERLHRTNSADTVSKLTSDAYLAIECTEFSAIGSFGDSKIGEPVAFDSTDELAQYAVELRKPGGSANFLKIRAQEKEARLNERKASKGDKDATKKGKAKQLESDKDTTTKTRHTSPGPVEAIAGPSSHSQAYQIRSTKTRRKDEPSDNTPNPTTKTKKREKKLNLQRLSDATYKRELVRSFSPAGVYRIVESTEIHEKYRRIIETDGPGDDRQIEEEKPGFWAPKGVYLETPVQSQDLKRSHDLGFPVGMDVFSRNDTRRGTDADVASTSRISRAPGASRSTAPRDQSQPSRNPRNPGIDSQESKLNQQFYTPSTSLAARSSPRPLTSSPEQFITDWSDSVRGGSPPGDPGSDITEEEEGEKEEDLFVRDDDDEVEMEMEMEEVLTAGDNKEEKEKDLFSDDDGEQEIEGRIEHSGISSPPTSSPRRISSRRLPLTPTPAPRRKNSMAPPAFIRDRGVLQPPPPAQPRPPPLTQSTNPPPSQELGTTNISFDLDFTPEPVKNKHSPIKVDSPVPLRVMAMPPPRLRYPERGPYSDTSIILQVIPESSQFRLSPPPPAQPRRKLDSSLDRNPSPSIIDSQGPSSSSVVPRTNPKINKVASAATAPSAVFAVPQRRVPRPHQPVPLVMTSQTIPRILAPDSDTSGTHSQSQNGSQSQEQPQSQSQGQEPGQRQKQEASSKRQSQQSQPSGQSNSVTESDSQPTDTHSKKSELLLVLPQHTENLGTGSDHDDDHDSLFSGPDSDVDVDMTIEDHRVSAVEPLGNKVQNPSKESQLREFRPELRATEDDEVIARSSLEAQGGSHGKVNDAFSGVPLHTTTSRGAYESLRISAGNQNRDGEHQSTVDPIVTSVPRVTISSKESSKEFIPHDPQAWIKPSFLRKSTGLKRRAEGLEPASTIGEEIGAINGTTYQSPHVEPRLAPVRSTQSDTAPVPSKSRPSSKRSHTDQSEPDASRKKQKANTPNLGASNGIQIDSDGKQGCIDAAISLKLGGFGAEVDLIPAEKPFISWDRLTEISLKIGRARARQISR